MANNLSVFVESVSIRQDAHGRYSLNDLHKAAMSAGIATENHAPRIPVIHGGE